LLLLAGRLGRRLQRFDLGSHGRQIHVQRLVQQALLLCTVGLALGGELQPLEHGVLVRELVDEGLLEGQLGTCRAQHPTQLLGVGGVEWVGSDHEWESCRGRSPGAIGVCRN
jgi:hypothetical protein